MRYSVLAVALGFAAQSVNAQLAYDLPIRPAPARTIVEFPGVDIGGGILPSTNTNRLYYRIGESKLYLLDVATKRTTLVADGQFYNLHVSPLNDRLVFFRDSEDGKGSNIWTMPIEPKTGLKAGPARRVALSYGDQPRFSPDGKWIAFSAYDSAGLSETQHLAIIPADGGPERTVGPRVDGIATIRWSPDGRSIHYNAWLHNSAIPPANRAIVRLAVGGGQVDTLPIRFDVGYPGLSPDGEVIALREVGGRADYVLTDTRGAPRARFSLPAPFEALWGNPNWLGSHSLIATAVRRPNTVRIMDLTSGASRELLTAESEPGYPFLSPDGKRLATFATTRGKRVIVVVDVSTGARKEYATGLGQPPNENVLEWSPDGKALAFGPGGEPWRVLDLTTSAIREVGPKFTASGNPRWRSDSRALLYTHSATGRSDRSFSEASLDGANQVLHERVPDLPGTKMISDSIGVFNTDSGVFVVNVRTHALKQVSRYRSGHIVLDRHGALFALRLPEKREVEIFDATGTRQAQLNIPSLAGWQGHVPVPFKYHPDGRVIFVGRNGNDQFAVYAADHKSGTSRKMFDLPNRATLPVIDLSPDGKFVAYTVEGPPTSVIAEIDLSSFIPAGRTPRP